MNLINLSKKETLTKKKTKEKENKDSSITKPFDRVFSGHYLTLINLKLIFFLKK